MFYSFKDGPELVEAEQIRGFDSTWSPGDSLAEWKYKMRCTFFTVFSYCVHLDVLPMID